MSEKDNASDKRKRTRVMDHKHWHHRLKQIGLEENMTKPTSASTNNTPAGPSNSHKRSKPSAYVLLGSGFQL